MSGNLVSPEAFAAEEPPERVIGIETEYDVRRPNGGFDTNWTSSFYAPDVLEEVGLVGALGTGNICIWLSNGAYIYPDVSHLEYCTPESLGPRQATAAAHAGNTVLNGLVEASGEDYRIFRRSATVDAESGAIVTKGYHVNFNTPDIICKPEIFMLLETHLATQVFAWGGLVTKNGYYISPKAIDIGNHVTTIASASRTGRGAKPFGIIRPSTSDSDTNCPDYGHGRFEDRTKTPSSQWSDFMGTATTSVLMRVFENPALAEEYAQLRSLQLANTLTAFKHVATDMTMSKLHKMADGRAMSVIDIQEGLAQIGASIASKIKLPADEAFAVQQWRQIISDLRRIQDGHAELKSIANRIGWAGKYVYLGAKLGETAVIEGNIDALRFCLAWDRVVPRGAGQIFDEKRGIQPLPEEEIERLAVDAPSDTRANARAEYIKEDGTALSSLGPVRWPFVTLLQGDDQRLVKLHPYDPRRPKLGGHRGHKW